MGSSDNTNTDKNTSSTTSTAPSDKDPRGSLSGVNGDEHHNYWTDPAHSGIKGNKVAIDYTKYTKPSECKSQKTKPCGY